MNNTKFSEIVKNAAAAAGISSGFVNLTVDKNSVRHYSKIDGIDVAQVTTLIECVTISQIKFFGVDPAAYSLKNTDGLAGRFDSTRNYIFPLYALEKIFSAADYDRFYANYSKAVIERYEVKPTVKTEDKKAEKKESKILSMTKALIAPTSKRVIKDSVKAEEQKQDKAEEKKETVKTEVKPADPVKTERKAMIEAAKQSGKLIIAGVDFKKQEKADPKIEEKKADPVVKAEDPKVIEPTVTKSVTIDSDYLDKLTAAKSEKKAAGSSKKAGKKASKKTDDSFELLFV